MVILMEFDDIEGKSSPDSWSTCDYGSLQELSGAVQSLGIENSEAKLQKSA